MTEKDFPCPPSASDEASLGKQGCTASQATMEKRERIAAVILWGMEQQTDELVAGLKQRDAPLWQRAMKAAAALEGEVETVTIPRFSQRSEVLGWILKLGNDRKEKDTWLNTNHRSYLNIHVLADALETLSAQHNDHPPHKNTPFPRTNDSEDGGPSHV